MIQQYIQYRYIYTTSRDWRAIILESIKKILSFDYWPGSGGSRARPLVFPISNDDGIVSQSEWAARNFQLRIKACVQHRRRRCGHITRDCIRIVSSGLDELLTGFRHLLCHLICCRLQTETIFALDIQDAHRPATHIYQPGNPGVVASSSRAGHYCSPYGRLIERHESKRVSARAI